MIHQFSEDTAGTSADFLAQERIAVAGVSRRGDVAANFIYRKLRGTGRAVFAVNPNADRVQGDRCYHDLSSIPSGVGAVVIATPPRAASGLVRELKHSSGVLNPSRFMGRALSLRAIALDRCAVVLHDRFPCRLERPTRDGALPSGRGCGVS